MKFHLTCLAATLSLLSKTATALYAEDAGSFDFLVATTGHGVTKFAQAAFGGAVITSDAASSCYVASRSIETGEMQWRRNVCAIPSDDQSHAVVVLGDFVYTVDSTGSVRAWTAAEGNLVWDAQVNAAASPQIWTVEKDASVYVAVVSQVFDAATGKPVDIRAGGAPKSPPVSSVASCPAADLKVTVGPESLQVSQDLTLTGDLFVPDGDVVEGFTVLACSSDQMVTLLATASGTTTQLTFTKTGSEVATKIMWTAEEGLATVSSAIVLDASHLGVDDLVEEQDVVLARLTLVNRLASQWEGVLSMIGSGGESSDSRRNHIFGFVKVVAMLSQKSHRLWGMSTSGGERGSLRWTLDLPKNAEWHTMVHGTSNSPKALHGINGGTHSREILALSGTPDAVEWSCLDGTNGVVHAQGAVSVSSPVLQVLPIYGTAHSCRQASLLFHEDHSFTVVPDDKEVRDVIEQHMSATTNGLFTHVIDKQQSKLEAFQVSKTPEGSFSAKRVGQTTFSGEKVVSVTYPVRDEVVQSMSTVLGDDSLLLKYINPHMAVIITMSEKEPTEASQLASALTKKQGNAKKRKPAGVGVGAGAGEAAADITVEHELPNMFVNVVDTVSGRVLHRASHVQVDSKSPVSALISENWILYTFINQKTRRTELGVLTLHEGMIDSKGLTLFTSPEQTTSFSSFDARESKPVVLAKTYTYPKAVTALGATSTRGGISSRRILIASVDGKVTAIDRKLLETRRPMGEVKPAEKIEGLFP
jgi:hypothetical protein